jgi:hypothetical protein
MRICYICVGGFGYISLIYRRITGASGGIYIWS